MMVSKPDNRFKTRFSKDSPRQGRLTKTPMVWTCRVLADWTTHNTLYARLEGNRKKAEQDYDGQTWNTNEDTTSSGPTMWGATDLTSDQGQWRTFTHHRWWQCA